MQLSNKAKIALGLLVLLVIAFAILYFATRKNDQTPEPSPTATSDDIYAPGTTKPSQSPGAVASTEKSAASVDELLGISPTSSGTAVATSSRVARTPSTKVDPVNGLKYYEISVTPAPNARVLDWTRHYSSLKVYDGRNDPNATKSMCELIGLSNDWANSIEKIACDGINFVTGRIIEPMTSFACELNASALRLNYDPSIEYEFKNGVCFIIDRSS